MRTFTRLSVVAAAAAIASATALSGAGMAGAQNWEDDQAVLDSPSVLTITGLSALGPKGNYKNLSGRDLSVCMAYVFPGQYYNEIDRALKGDTNASIPDDVPVAGGFLVPAGGAEAGFQNGKTTDFTVGLLPGPSVNMNNAAVVSICVGGDGASAYSEIELARVPGGGGLFGSLGGGFPFGS